MSVIDPNEVAKARKMRGHSALYAAADLVIEDGKVVKSRYDDAAVAQMQAAQENAADAAVDVGGPFPGFSPADAVEQRRAADQRRAERREEQLRGLRAHCLQMACDKAHHGVASSEIVRVAGEFYAFITKAEG